MLGVCIKCRRRYNVPDGEDPGKYACDCGGKLYAENDPRLQEAEAVQEAAKKIAVQRSAPNIKVKCLHCGKEKEVLWTAAGRKYRCTCGGEMEIPQATGLPSRVRKCPDCGGVVSILANDCPHCGAPQWHIPQAERGQSSRVQVTDIDLTLWNMAKLVLCFCAACFLISLVGGIIWGIITSAILK